MSTPDPLALHWLPRSDDFRERLRAARALDAGPARFAALAALAGHRIGYAESLLLDRAVKELPSHDDVPQSRLALLSNCTVDQLVPGLRSAALRRGLQLVPHVGQFGQYRQEVLDAGSALYRFAPAHVLLSLSARAFATSQDLGIDASAADRAVDAFIDELRFLWQRIRQGLRATPIQQTFLNVADPVFGNLDASAPGSPAALVHLLNSKLAAAARTEGVPLLDLATASQGAGLDAWHDEALWLQGKLEIAPQAGALYGELALRIIGAERGLSRKCLVLDLDNTLWGGVIGDDGLEGIVLGEGTALGEAHLALQRYALRLRERGIILAVCSKNEASIAMQAFEKHPEMALKAEHIAAFHANWEPKPQNLRAIASRLNIGLDSLVFVDDNPAERAAVREALPMVAVPELPADAAHYVRCVSQAGYFEALSFTSEDRQRGESYAANAARDAARESSGTLEEFLSGLDMIGTFDAVGPVDLARATQLINKTNQFNTTTRRRTQDEVAALLADASTLTLQVRLADRFGDNGLIAVALLVADPAHPRQLVIDTWVMSCRVFGRQLEHETMNELVSRARARGAESLRAAYIPTAKNGVVKALYEGLGFSPDGGSADGTTWWRLDLASYRPTSTHIRRTPP